MTADELRAAPHYVYRLRESDGTLLYVGCSVDPEARLAAHRCDRPWSDLIARQDVEGPYSRADALAREAAAITAEAPRFNLAHNLAPELWDGPSEEAFLYVKRLVRLSGRRLVRAFWRGEIPMEPTDSEIREWAHTLSWRHRAYPCPWHGRGCYVAADDDDEAVA